MSRHYLPVLFDGILVFGFGGSLGVVVVEPPGEYLGDVLELKRKLKTISSSSRDLKVIVVTHHCLWPTGGAEL